MKERHYWRWGVAILAYETTGDGRGGRSGGVEGWLVRWWVDGGSVGWFAWRNCAAVEAARLSARERSIAMRRLLIAAALAYGFFPRSNVSSLLPFLTFEWQRVPPFFFISLSRTRFVLVSSFLSSYYSPPIRIFLSPRIITSPSYIRISPVILYRSIV